MRKVLTSGQMRVVDRLTIETNGIASLQLMENAANAVVGSILARLGDSFVDETFLVLCGKGNNGGDGAAVARLLTLSGAEVTVVLFGKIADTTGDARTNFEAASEVVHSFIEVGPLTEGDDWLPKHFQDIDVVVDAVFGTGLDRPLDPWLSRVMRQINTLNKEVRDNGKNNLAVSIDIPSGLNADLSEPIGEAFQADLTVTFTAPKPANILTPASNFNGDLVIADIGSPRALIESQDSNLYLAEREDVSRWLADTEFTDHSYKNQRGHALIIAGSRNYSGAAVLCGDAAIRSGVGLVTLAVPESSRESIIARVSPEVMVRGIAETPDGSIGEDAGDVVTAILKNIDAVAIGSGLSAYEETTKRFVRRMIEQRTTPVVIDADGLTALSPFEISGSAERPLILTPHEGEFMRLLGMDDKRVIADRAGAVRSFAMKHSVILVLKGERVLIGGPAGEVIVNPTGNSGLGKAGNGDTLTGIVTGFVAQSVRMGVDILRTVTAAVYIAGLAGDIAEDKYGKRVMTASDVRDCLKEAFGRTQLS